MTMMSRLLVLIIMISVLCGLGEAPALAQSWEFNTSSLEVLKALRSRGYSLSWTRLILAGWKNR